ncbi:MAG: Fic family protein [Deltaproteobacteria bacterium]|nr:Fic family protein [Deltaproteobacteria bacterium]
MYQPAFKTSVRATRLLEQIAERRERIRNSLVRVPWVPSLAADAMARQAWGSTAIEGCTLSLEAIQGLLKGKEAVGYPDRHIRMAVNYLKALAWIQKKEKVKRLGEKDLFHLHKIIGEEALDEGPIGSYRKVDVRAGLHVAPPWEKVPELTRDLFKWLEKEAAELPAVFSSAILHLRLAEIHPFRDGNGRVTRALATWELYHRGFDTLHVFALDEVLQENRNLYIKNLQRVQVEGEDLGGWIEFVAEAFLETLERVEKRIEALSPLVETPLSLTIRQEKLLHLLRERGTMGIRDLERALRLTVPGVHYTMKPLLEAGLVKKLGSYKNTRYSLTTI